MTAMPRCRKFKLIDGMILIAAAAGWMAMSRGLWTQPRVAYAPLNGNHWLYKVGMASMNGIPLYAYVGPFHVGLICAVVMLAVTYVAIRLIPPRLPESDLICQPGMLSLGLLVALFFLYMALAQMGLLNIWTDLIMTVAVGVSWSAACWFYRSRAEPGWIEGLGRSFGVSLVLSIAMTYISSLVI
jgi:hypothetical protein